MQPLPYTYQAISMEKTNFKAYNPNLSSILENRSLQGNLQGNPRLINWIFEQCLYSFDKRFQQQRRNIKECSLICSIPKKTTAFERD